jgi:hypothetical protein
MAGGIIGWRFFDAESGLVPEGSGLSALPGGGKGRVVVLAATPFTISKGWAARAAVTLAKEWSGEGLRIFLMDLGLDDPSLHNALGLPNGEGVSDAFLFGASVQHIAKPVLEDAFFFASAGSPPGDPEEVLGHPRWADLTGGFSEADATLVLFLPTEIAGADKILSRATEIVFLSAQGESADTHIGPDSTKVVSVMGPFGSDPAGLPDVREEIDEVQEEMEEVWEEIDEPEAPETAAGDGFGPEFGAVDPGGDDEEASSLDFSGGLELDANFGADEVLAEEPEGIDEPLAEAPERIDDRPAGDASGGGIVMGSDFSGPTGSEGSVGDILGGDSDVPDFGSDFVDMGPTDNAVDMGPADNAGGGGGRFGGDLVQGPDVGSQPPAAMDTQRAEAPVSLPPKRAKPAPRRRSSPKKRFPLGMAVLIIILLGVIGAVTGNALGYLNLPALPFLQNPFGDPPEPILVLPGPQANEEVLWYSLVIRTYDQGEVDDATQMMEALQSRLPNLLITLVLGEDEGETTYTLLAGPARDRIEAENLKAPLAEVLTREDPSSWSVRETPRAFYLGEHETLAEAQHYMAALSLEGVFSYILRVTYPSGVRRYRVLSGAFAGIEDARPLQRSLLEGGFSDVPLIERRGRLPE